MTAEHERIELKFWTSADYGRNVVLTYSGQHELGANLCSDVVVLFVSHDRARFNFDLATLTGLLSEALSVGRAHFGPDWAAYGTKGHAIGYEILRALLEVQSVSKS